jgi:uncharacterized membrane protein
VADETPDPKRERRALRRLLDAEHHSKEEIIRYAAKVQAERDGAIEMLALACDVLGNLTGRTRLEVAATLRDVTDEHEEQ